MHRVLVCVRGLEEAALKDLIFLFSMIGLIQILPSYQTVAHSIEKNTSKTHRKLQVKLSAAGFYFLRVVEPLHFTHHAGLARLPQHLDLPDVRSVASSSGEKHGAVIHVEDVSPPLY